MYLTDPDDQSDWEISDDASVVGGEKLDAHSHGSFDEAVGLKLLEDGPAGNHLQMESTIPVERASNAATNIPEACMTLPWHRL